MEYSSIKKKNHLFYFYKLFALAFRTFERIKIHLLLLTFKGYKEAFAIFDRKCKGRIAARNLGALMRTLGRNPLEQELSDIIDEFTDRSKS